MSRDKNFSKQGILRIISRAKLVEMIDKELHPWQWDRPHLVSYIISYWSHYREEIKELLDEAWRIADQEEDREEEKEREEE